MERVRLTWHRPGPAAADETRLQEVVAGIHEQQFGNVEYAEPARLHLVRALGISINYMPLIGNEGRDLPYGFVAIPLIDVWAHGTPARLCRRYLGLPLRRR